MEPLADKLVSHRPWLRRLARRMVRSPASADDLVQDTCITALRNAPPDAQMRPWLRSVMRKLAWGYVRSEQRRAQREELFSHAAPPTSQPDALLEYGVDRARLAQAVETLPEPFRSTVVQRFIEGRSCAEIARDEKVPDGTVRWRQSRALELLRSELDGPPASRRARRRHLIWGLPLAGAGERIATRVGETLFSLLGQSKAMWLVLAGVAAAIGLGSLRDARQHAGSREPAAAHVHHAAAASLHTSGSDQGQQPGRAGALLAHGLPRLQRSEPNFFANDSRAGGTPHIETDEQRERRRSFEALRDQYEPHLDDCELDDHGSVRCHEPRLDPRSPGRPTCDSINHNVAFTDISRRFNFMTHPYANRFLTAAMLANVALGASLGCSLVTDTGGQRNHQVSVVGAGSDCVTREGPNGEPCTTCTDGSAETTMCAPADCRVETMLDGAICTTCVDVTGKEETVCEEQPRDCKSELTSFGLVCTTCTVDDQPVTTCASAQCGVKNRCLECTDPRGNTATDCSQDYEVMPTGSYTSSDADTFESCNVSWGYPDGSTAGCDYPGPDTCTAIDYGYARCIECTRPDGGEGMSRCLFDPNEPLPELPKGRPNLPVPGTCMDTTSADGKVLCTTCTRHDLSATTSCRLPAAIECEPIHTSDYLLCVRCTHADGSNRTFCPPNPV
jgi:RNA polymerase sigma factor (sigma-70 family)